MPEEAAKLRRAGSMLARGAWPSAALDCVVLTFDDRHRRRLIMRGVRGTDFLLDLAATTALRGGDALVLDDGALIEVVAAPEALLEISATDAAAMVRIAYHLGNRHLAVQLAGRRLRIRHDHVIAAMVEGLGGRSRPIEAPFDPEGGAYAGHAHADAGSRHHSHNSEVGTDPHAHVHR